MNIDEYAARKHVSVSLADSQGDQGLSWHRGESGWVHFLQRVTIKIGNRRMTIDWRQGQAHGTKIPTAGDVLGSLISDAMAYETCPTLEDFAAEYGYDTTEPDGKRRAQKIYTQLKNYHPRIIRLVGGQEEFDYITQTIDY